MPRLPTIRVIGSQAISTKPVSSAVVMGRPLFLAAARGTARLRGSPGLLEARQELVAPLAPLGLLVGGLGGEAAKSADHGAVHHAGRRGDLRSRRLVHERHELVREARHGARDADAAHVRAAAHAVDPAALGHVALDHGPPAAQLDQALGRAILAGEVTLLVVAGPAAAPRPAGSSAPAPLPGRAGRGWSPTGCPGESGSPARRRWADQPWTASPSRGSQVRPSRRSGCPPWRGCRRR